MRAGFTMNSSISVGDRGSLGNNPNNTDDLNDPFTVEINVTDGTSENTYTSSQTFYLDADAGYVTVTSSLIVP
jgi:hypothetical protein